MDSILLYVVFLVAFFAMMQGFVYFSRDLREETRDAWSRIRRPRLADGVSPWLRDILLTAPIRTFDTLVQTCGFKIRTEWVLFLMMMLSLLLVLLLDMKDIGAPLPNFSGSFAVGIGFPLLLFVWIRDRRMAKLTNQIPETLDMMVRSLKAGHPIPVSIAMVATEMPAPIGVEFKRVADSMSFGLDLRQALTNMSERLHTVPELKYVVSAIRIQAASGGNLAEVLSSLAKLMREQHKLKMKVKAISAEGRLSGNILAVLPIALFGVICLVSPGYYGEELADSVALKYTLMAALSHVIAGYLVIRRIVNIRV